jgi:hypothetical protein
VVHGGIIIPNDCEGAVNSFLAVAHVTADFKAVPFERVRMIFRMLAALVIAVLLGEQILAAADGLLRLRVLMISFSNASHV